MCILRVCLKHPSGVFIVYIVIKLLFSIKVFWHPNQSRFKRMVISTTVPTQFMVILIFLEKQSLSALTMIFPLCRNALLFNLFCHLNVTADYNLINRYMQHCIFQFSLEFFVYNCILFLSPSQWSLLWELPTKNFSGDSLAV